ETFGSREISGRLPAAGSRFSPGASGNPSGYGWNARLSIKPFPACLAVLETKSWEAPLIRDTFRTRPVRRIRGSADPHTPAIPSVGRDSGARGLSRPSTRVWIISHPGHDLDNFFPTPLVGACIHPARFGFQLS